MEDGGKAALSRRLQPGDELVNISGTPLYGSRQEALILIKGSYRTLKMIVRRLARGWGGGSGCGVTPSITPGPCSEVGRFQPGLPCSPPPLWAVSLSSPFLLAWGRKERQCRSPQPPCSHSAGCSQPGCSAGGHRGSWAVPPLGRSLIHGEFKGARGWGKGPLCPPLRPHSLHAEPWGVGQPYGCWGWQMAFVECREWHHPFYPYGNA